VTSIDEASGAVGGNAEQARDLVNGLTASKEIIEDLAGGLSELGIVAKADQARAASDQAEALTSRANGLAESLDALRAQIEALSGLLASAGGSVPSTLPRQADGSKTTRPSLPPDPNRKPGGPLTEAGKHGDLKSENEVAAILARNGYEIAQNPPSKTNGKRPDYFMEGDYWDCYTVSTHNPERVRKSIRDKANPRDGKVQADRVVLNFDFRGTGDGTTLTPEIIEALLQRKPIKGLKEVKVIKDGSIRDLDLDLED
jgi:hypothetical protein